MVNVTTAEPREASQLNWPMIIFWPIMYLFAGLAIWRLDYYTDSAAPGLKAWVLLATAGIVGFLVVKTIVKRKFSRFFASISSRAGPMLATKLPPKVVQIYKKLDVLINLTTTSACALLTGLLVASPAWHNVNVSSSYWPWLVVMGATFAGFMCFCGFGVTIGYHRGFTHKGFKTSRPVTAVLLTGGGLAFQNPALIWIEDHLAHHANTDEWDDPHSPWRYAKIRKVTLPSGKVVYEEYVTAWGLIKGLLWAHMGWLFVHRKKPKKSPEVPQELREDPMFILQKKYYLAFVVATILIPTLIGAGFGFATAGTPGILMGAIDGFLIPGILRIMVLLNFTWSINSVCHVWGKRAVDSEGNEWKMDNARNIRVLGPFTGGESYHSEHHVDQTNAYHGKNKGDLDTSKWILIIGEKIGLFWDIVKPDRKDRKGRSRRDRVFTEKEKTRTPLVRPNK